VTEVALGPDHLLAGPLSVAFQPIYELRGERRRLHSLEALVRGPRGTAFESAPLLFEYVRRTGQEGPMDRACLAAIFAALEAVSWRPDLAVNVHASTLGGDEGLVPFLAELAARHRLAPSRLTVEIVEHAATCDARLVVRNLDRLRALGVRIALDDVGVGQSNYRMMLDCRPDFLKVDRYLVVGCHDDPRRQAVLESVARLGPRMGARVVAEGVESQAELWTVAALGIDLVQGFFLSRPLPSGEVPPEGWSPLPGSEGAADAREAVNPQGLAAREVRA